MAYQGLKKHSTVVVDVKYLTPSQVSGGTCIGGKDYYYKREITTGTGGLGLGLLSCLGLNMLNRRGSNGCADGLFDGIYAVCA